MQLSRLLSPVSLLFVLWFLPTARAQEVLGTGMGIPQNSPGVLWPRGMSIEGLSPQNLYPNGTQFGLSNTAGGFGMSGSGPISGVGLAQRSVSPLVQKELQNPSVFVNRLSIVEAVEQSRSQTLLSTLTSTNFRVEMSRPSLLQAAEVNRPIVQTYMLPSADTLLQDRPPTTDSILRTGL
jgi:hypothetical protein